MSFLARVNAAVGKWSLLILLELGAGQIDVTALYASLYSAILH